jgi:hypothetical protein
MLSLKIFLISRTNFPYFIIFSASVLGMLRVKVTAISIISAVCILSVSTDEHYITSVEIY